MSDQNKTRDELLTELRELRRHYREVDGQRQRAEKALRESEARFRAFLDHSPAVAYLKDEQGRYIYASEPFRRLFQRGGTEVLGRCTAELFSPEDARRLEQQDREVLAANRPLTTREMLPTADGAARWWLTIKFPVFDGGGRRYLGGVAVDITERHQAEEALRQSEQQLMEAQRIAHVGSWEWELATDAVTWSDELYRIFGLPPGRPWPSPESFFERVPPEDRERVRRVVEQSLHERRPFDHEHRILRADGAVRVLHARGRVVLGPDGRPVRLMGTAQDVTERRRLEEKVRQTQKLEAVGRLAGGVAHDFNNAMTVVIGFSDLILGEPGLGDAIRPQVQQIRHAAERAANLTAQLLAFGRKSIAAPRLFDLNTMLYDLLPSLGRLLGEDITIETELLPDAGTIRADPGLMQQVVLNLAINARDAMPQGGRLTLATAAARIDEASAQARPEAQPGRYVELTVRDTGRGMDEATLRHIFEPFFTTKELGQGSGMGLATVYGIVKQAGGFVEVESRPEVGTAFHVFLPRVDSAELAAPAAAAKPWPGGTETILLVEDEAAVRTLARQVLQQCGYTVLEAFDGEDALGVDARHTNPVHLLLTDVVMPRMGGRELAERLARRRPELRVLYLSGHNEDAILRHGLLTEQAHFLAKPFGPEVLARKVREVLDA